MLADPISDRPFPFEHRSVEPTEKKRKQWTFSETTTRRSYFQFGIRLRNGLCFMRQLGKAGAEDSHFRPTFVGNLRLILVDFPEQEIEIDKGFIEFFLQNIHPTERTDRDRHERRTITMPASQRWCGDDSTEKNRTDPLIRARIEPVRWNLIGLHRRMKWVEVTGWERNPSKLQKNKSGKEKNRIDVFQCYSATSRKELVIACRNTMQSGWNHPGCQSHILPHTAHIGSRLSFQNPVQSNFIE